MLLLLISFIAGVLTILAPCILPLLPVIVGGSLSDGKVNIKKALTIVVSLGVSVIAFTLLLKVSTLFIDIPQYVWTAISGGIVLFFGIVTLFPSLWENKFMARMSTRFNILIGKGDQKKSVGGDILIGASLGPVFSTCSPTYFIVLATVLPVAPIKGIVYLLAYVVGLSISLLVVTFLGQKIMSKLDIAADPRGVFKQVLGILFIVVGIAVLTGYDKKIQTSILDSGYFDVTQIEQRLLEHNIPESEMNVLEDSNIIFDGESMDNEKEGVSTPSRTISNAELAQILARKNSLLTKVPELSSIDGYINTEGVPLTLNDLKGKVVLLDIWTYSCINCQRTIPYLNAWYEKYKDQGLVIVGLHTPEFAFEKNKKNVENAVEKFGIKYPVVLDNDYSTWKALGNQFWPRKYLVDIDGYIVYDHIGEGAYDETEKEIVKALKERAERIGSSTEELKGTATPKNVVSVDMSQVKSPEIYFGSARNNNLANGSQGKTGQQSMTIPIVRTENKVYLGGTWNFVDEYAENTTASSVVFSYNAKNVYMTAGSKDGVEVEIYIDEVFVKKILIQDQTLYTLIEGESYGPHVLKIIIPSAGLQAFTFTFG